MKSKGRNREENNDLAGTEGLSSKRTGMKMKTNRIAILTAVTLTGILLTALTVGDSGNFTAGLSQPLSSAVSGTMESYLRTNTVNVTVTPSAVSKNKTRTTNLSGDNNSMEIDVLPPQQQPQPRYVLPTDRRVERVDYI
jgi:hypothetical protein